VAISFFPNFGDFLQEKKIILQKDIPFKTFIFRNLLEFHNKKRDKF